MLELLRELCREREVAVVLVSHDPLAAGYADRVLALRDGKLTELDRERASRAARASERERRAADRRAAPR